MDYFWCFCCGALTDVSYLLCPLCFYVIVLSLQMLQSFLFQVFVVTPTPQIKLLMPMQQNLYHEILDFCHKIQWKKHTVPVKCYVTWTHISKNTNQGLRDLYSRTCFFLGCNVCFVYIWFTLWDGVFHILHRCLYQCL